LEAALSELGFGKSIVATALNGEFIATSVRAATVLAEGDRVEIVAPMQGG
jgi:sulfur carrier protein